MKLGLGRQGHINDPSSSWAESGERCVGAERVSQNLLPSAFGEITQGDG